MTPYEIRVLLHFFMSPAEPPDAPLLLPTCKDFERAGLLREREPDATMRGRYEITARGEAYCRALQSVPLPEPAWILPAQPERCI